MGGQLQIARDFAALPVTELAPLWVEINSRSPLGKEKDKNWSELFDFQSELVNNDPLKALDLVKAIVDIEDNPSVLGLLAAGMLEDLIPAVDGPVVGRWWQRRRAIPSPPARRRVVLWHEPRGYRKVGESPGKRALVVSPPGRAPLHTARL